MNNNPKMKLFFGNAFGTRVDEQFGEWIEDHPRVKILDFRYEYSKTGEHSIAILYEEDGIADAEMKGENL